jgi:predicted dithiol-disulfide oxidoreductase (DUF899 family)
VNLPRIVTREEWLVARKELLAQEKEATAAKDAIDERRRALPMVEIGKDYVFEGPEGKVRLPDLFEGRRQLVVYHFMWLHDRNEGCPSCSLVGDGVGDLTHLHECDTSLVFVSRARLADIERFRDRMGWHMPWYSSADSHFNYDFGVSVDESVAPVEYNYKDRETLERQGLARYTTPGNDAHGVSVFLREGDRVFHSYSSYGRGPEPLITPYLYLDLTPLGRQKHVSEFAHHDRYGTGEVHVH